MGLAGLCLAIVASAPLAATSAQDCSGGTFILSAVTVTGLAVFDIATAPTSARRYNERHALVVPYVDPRQRSFGLSVSLSLGRSRPAPPVQLPVRAAWPVVGDTGGTHKSPGTAFAISFLSTAVPMAVGAGAGSDQGAALFLGGLIIGPSTGHFYAGRAGRGLATIGLRALGTVVGISSVSGCFTD